MARTAQQMVEDANAKVESITPHEAFDRLAAGKAVLLDVREPIECAVHIDGSVMVPRGVLEFTADPTSPRHHPSLDPAHPVIVVCQSGARSALAAVTLKELGFAEVLNLAGGFTAWQAAGLPTIDTGANA